MKVPHNPTIGHQQPHTSQHHAAIEMARKDRPSQMAATKARWALSTAMGVSFPTHTFVSTPPAPRKLALTHLRRPIQPHALLLNNRRRPISKIQGRREQARQSTTQRRQVFSLRCPLFQNRKAGFHPLRSHEPTACAVRRLAFESTRGKRSYRDPRKFAFLGPQHRMGGKGFTCS